MYYKGNEEEYSNYYTSKMSAKPGINSFYQFYYFPYHYFIVILLVEIPPYFIIISAGVIMMAKELI